MLMCIATSNIEAKQESQMIKTEECTWGGGGVPILQMAEFMVITFQESN